MTDQEKIVERGCGLDVHKNTVTACIQGKRLKKIIKTYQTTTKDLLNLNKWLKENKITHVAIESTGVFWKPVFNILGEDFEVILVNARHIKNVPGRKTDVKDSEWICTLLRKGLLSASFIPPVEVRNLRDLTRYQKRLTFDLTKTKNRIHKLLQESNIKLSSVLSDVFGVSGMKILEDMSQGITDPEKLAVHLKFISKNKRQKGKEALEGKITDHHIFLLSEMIDKIKFIRIKISKIEERVNSIIESGFKEERELLKTIPGISDRSSHIILAEIGKNTEVFPTEHHLSSWSGICPGNNESGGKKKALECKKVINISNAH